MFAIKALLSLSVLALGAGLAVLPQQAVAAPTLADGVCPAVGADGAGCGILITIDVNGAATVSNPHGQGPYDSSEDTLVGVINNSANAVGTLGLSGSNIFGFEGDGACSSTYLNCSYGGSGYAGLSTNTVGSVVTNGSETFAITDYSNGSITFDAALQTGDTAWFSLEESLSAATFQITTVNGNPNPVPEPASMTIIAFALAAFGVMRRNQA